jgi:hypothetical protein
MIKDHLGALPDETHVACIFWRLAAHSSFFEGKFCSAKSGLKIHKGSFVAAHQGAGRSVEYELSRGPRAESRDEAGQTRTFARGLRSGQGVGLSLERSTACPK